MAQNVSMLSTANTIKESKLVSDALFRGHNSEKLQCTNHYTKKRKKNFNNSLTYITCATVIGLIFENYPTY